MKANETLRKAAPCASCGGLRMIHGSIACPDCNEPAAQQASGKTVNDSGNGIRSYPECQPVVAAAPTPETLAATFPALHGQLHGQFVVQVVMADLCARIECERNDALSRWEQVSEKLSVADAKLWEYKKIASYVEDQYETCKTELAAITKECDYLRAKLAAAEMDSARDSLLRAASYFDGTLPFNWVCADGYSNALDIAGELQYMASEIPAATKKVEK